MKLNENERVELSSTVAHITTKNFIESLKLEGPLSKTDEHIIELSSYVAATAISITIQYLQEHNLI